MGRRRCRSGTSRSRPARARRGSGGRVVSPLARTIEALLFLAPEPVPAAELADAAGARRPRPREALGELAEAAPPAGAASCCASWPAASRWPATPRPSPPPGGCWPPAHPAAHARAGRDARRRGLPAAGLAAGDHAHPRRERRLGDCTLLDRGLIEEAGRSQFGAVLYRTTPLFLKLFGLGSLDDLPDPAQWDPSPDEEADLRDRLLRRAKRARRCEPPKGPNQGPSPMIPGRCPGTVLIPSPTKGLDEHLPSAPPGARRRRPADARGGRHRARRRPPLRRRRHRRQRAARRLARDRPRPAHRRHGPVGLGQVDAHAHPRRPRPADGGRGRIAGIDIGGSTTTR